MADVEGSACDGSWNRNPPFGKAWRRLSREALICIAALAGEIKRNWNLVIGVSRRATAPCSATLRHGSDGAGLIGCGIAPTSAHPENAGCRLNLSFRLFFNEASTNPI